MISSSSLCIKCKGTSRPFFITPCLHPICCVCFEKVQEQIRQSRQPYKCLQIDCGLIIESLAIVPPTKRGMNLSMQVSNVLGRHKTQSSRSKSKLKNQQKNQSNNRNHSDQQENTEIKLVQSVQELQQDNILFQIQEQDVFSSKNKKELKIEETPQWKLKVEQLRKEIRQQLIDNFIQKKRQQLYKDLKLEIKENWTNILYVRSSNQQLKAEKSNLIVNKELKMVHHNQKKYYFSEILTQLKQVESVIIPLLRKSVYETKIAFSYGHSGSGKSTLTKQILGQYYQVTINQCKMSQIQVYPSLSCIQINYSNKRQALVDLLSKEKKAPIKKVRQSIKVQIKSFEEFQSIIKSVQSRRETAENSTNKYSSRSHLVIQLSNPLKGRGSLTLFDLAGMQDMNANSSARIKSQTGSINGSLQFLNKYLRDKKKEEYSSDQNQLLLKVIKDIFNEVDDKISTYLISVILQGSEKNGHTLEQFFM